ncbi:MAG: tetratricopeptide repeat protein [Vulcanimicrobiaceae bacterium]
MADSQQRGLPPRVYIPIVAIIAVVFLGLMAWLLHIGFGTSGSVFGSGTGAPGPGASAAPAQQQAPGSNVNVEGGGPPAAVQIQLAQLRARIAKNPKDDVALTQLGDLYLAAGIYDKAIPLYQRALAVNPKNAAASEGLSQARAALSQEQH